MKKSIQKGFTLIELLVVVAVIGVLATVVIGQLGKARTKAQIAKIDIEMQSIKKNLELYYIDHGNYPEPNSGNPGELFRYEAYAIHKNLDMPANSVFAAISDYGFDYDSFKNNLTNIPGAGAFTVLGFRYGLGNNAIRATCYGAQSQSMGTENYVLGLYVKANENIKPNSEVVYESGTDKATFCYSFK